LAKIKVQQKVIFYLQFAPLLQLVLIPTVFDSSSQFAMNLDDIIQWAVTSLQELSRLSTVSATDPEVIIREAMATTKGYPAQEETLMQTPVPDHSRSKRKIPDATNTDLLLVLQSIDSKIDTTNRLLGEFISAYQAWRQVDLPRAMGSIQVSTPSGPELASHALSSEATTSVGLLMPQFYD
jgi:hypothetical protein